MRQIARRSSARYTRRSFFVDEGAIRRARRVLGVHTNAEAVRLAVERVVEMEEFWRFMTRSRASLKPRASRFRDPVWAIIDTSVYIGHWERGRYDEVLEKVRRAFIVRHSAVVLSELRRGARTRAAERIVARLHALARDPWTPNNNDWWEAGRLIRTIGDAHDWDRHRRRDFQNDALIALTARRHGATVVTANHEDFGLLGRKLRVRILAV